MISNPSCLFAVGVPGMTLFIEALVLVVAAVFVWAAFIRKAGERHPHHDRPHHWRASKSAEGKSTKPSVDSKGRQRRRRKGRPLNPTLAETGGLPPVRRPEIEPPATA
ncbi:MAG: hypothetical protein ACTHLW_19510 [Verrucomicrobiota bacterium]